MPVGLAMCDMTCAILGSAMYPIFSAICLILFRVFADTPDLPRRAAEAVVRETPQALAKSRIDGLGFMLRLGRIT